MEKHSRTGSGGAERYPSHGLACSALSRALNSLPGAAAFAFSSRQIPEGNVARHAGLSQLLTRLRLTNNTHKRCPCATSRHQKHAPMAPGVPHVLSGNTTVLVSAGAESHHSDGAQKLLDIVKCSNRKSEIASGTLIGEDCFRNVVGTKHAPWRMVALGHLAAAGWQSSLRQRRMRQAFMVRAASSVNI